MKQQLKLALSEEICECANHVIRLKLKILFEREKMKAVELTVHIRVADSLAAWAYNNAGFNDQSSSSAPFTILFPFISSYHLAYRFFIAFHWEN